MGNLQVLIRLREFNFGQYNTLQNIVIDVDLPSNVFMDDEVPNLVQNSPVAHRSQYFFGVSAGYRVFKFRSNQTYSTTFQGNGCFVVCDANSGFMAVVIRYQSVSNVRVSDDVFFPSIIRDKKLALDFQWHGGIISALMVVGDGVIDGSRRSSRGGKWPKRSLNLYAIQPGLLAH
jgi:hypothetical protein